MVEFNENGGLKTKNNLVNCVVEDEKHRLIIIITYNKYTFFVNNEVQKT